MRGKVPRSLASFTCVTCGEKELVTGGTARFLCSKCKPANHYTLTAQYQAHFAVARAKKEGVLASPTNFACVDCGKPATQYDHRDYNKPLTVEPVCKRCNLHRGPAIGSPAKRAIRQPQPEKAAA